MLKHVLVNTLLVAGSILLATALAAGVDRIVGPPAARQYGGERMALLFAPGAVEHVKTVEFEMTARMNNLGLRDNDIPPGKSSRFRIVAIGDSFTHGWGVELEDTWVKQLEAELRARGYDVEIINAGQSGMNTAFYRAMARRIVPVLQPDLVLVGMLHNDIGMSNMERVGLWRPVARRVFEAIFPNAAKHIAQRALEAEQQQVNPLAPTALSIEQNRANFANMAKETVARFTSEQKARFDAMDPEVKRLFLEGQTNPFMVSVGISAPGFYTSLLALRDFGWEEVVQRVGGYLAQLKDIAAGHGADTVTAIIPAGPYCNRPQWEAVRRLGFDMREEMLSTGTPDALTMEASALAGIPCLSVTETFRRHQDDATLYYPLDNHFSAAGHALYAKSLAPLLEPYLKDAPRITSNAGGNPSP
jgi:lysophospholipase L1-like esterase